MGMVADSRMCSIWEQCKILLNSNFLQTIFLFLCYEICLNYCGVASIEGFYVILILLKNYKADVCTDL